MSRQPVSHTALPGVVQLLTCGLRCPRPKDLKAYTLEHNGRLGRDLLELELSRAGGSAASGEHQGASAGTEDRSSARHVLIGHSMGAACAAAEVIANPEVRLAKCSLVTDAGSMLIVSPSQQPAHP